jgi:hypothetical protein
MFHVSLVSFAPGYEAFGYAYRFPMPKFSAISRQRSALLLKPFK